MTAGGVRVTIIESQPSEMAKDLRKKSKLKELMARRYVNEYIRGKVSPSA